MLVSTEPSDDPTHFESRPRSANPTFLLSLCVVLVWVSSLSAKGTLPLEGSTTFETEVDSVSWLSFDLSPDGQTFVLEVLGDLYTLPIEGGTATVLSSGIAFDSQPSYSPDGTRIAFVSDRSGSENIWLVESDGTNPRMLSDAKEDGEFMSPSWAPDGSHVIASMGSWEHRTYAVWAYHLDGGRGVQLLPVSSGSDSDSLNHVGAVYSPDSRYLYYAFKRQGFGYNLSLPLWQIRRLTLETSRQVTLTDAVGSAFRPALSPDGILLVYGTRFDTQTGLRIRNLTTGSDQWLVYPVQRDDQESRYTRDLLPPTVFSPDGKRIYFTRDGKLEGLDIETRESFAIDFEIPVKLAVEERMVFPYRIGQGPVKAQLIRGSEISPGGKRVAFSALAQIHIYDFESKKATPLTESDMFSTHPTWSPDGKEIAFVDWETNGGNIWRINSRKGAKPRKVTKHAGFYFDPVWTSNGDYIVALRASGYERSVIPTDFGQGVDSDLVRVNVRNGEVKLIAHAPSLSRPHFGPETDRIYLYEWPGTLREGSSGLISMRFDGTDRRKHLSLTGPGIYNSPDGLPATSIQLSPKGDYVLAKQATQLYALRLLSTKGATIKTKVTRCSLPCERLTDVGVDEFGFDVKNDAVFWTIGHSVFRRPLSSLFEEEKQEEPSTSETGDGATPPSEEQQKSNLRERKRVLPEDHVSVQEDLIEIYAPRRVVEQPVVLRNATVIAIQKDKPDPQFETDILLSNGRIQAIGSDIEVAEEVDSIDLSGKFILPGYVDTHSHIPLMRSVTGGQPWGLLANLAYGVTTTFDVQPSTVDILEYEDLVDAGTIVGPRVLSTGPGVFSDTDFESKEDALRVLTRYRDHYGVRNTKTYLIGNREKRQWLIQASRELSLNSTTEGALDMKLDLTYALDGFTGLEHALPVVGIHEDVVQLFAFTGIAYTPTLLVSYGGPFGENYFFTQENPRGDEKLARFTPPALLDALLLRRPWFHRDAHVFSRHAAQARKIVLAGGRVGVGSHGELNGLGFHWELWALSMGGFTNFEALRAATRHGAEMIGIAQDVGSIEVGKLADLVVLNSNPLLDIRSTSDIHAIVSHGVIRDGETLEEIWPETAVVTLPQWDMPN